MMTETKKKLVVMNLVLAFLVLVLFGLAPVTDDAVQVGINVGSDDDGAPPGRTYLLMSTRADK